MFSHFRIVLISTIISTFAFADLFFSEYAEGSSNNKWLEVYNPTDNAVDLSGYLLGNTSNAPTTAGEPEFFTAFTGATLGSGEVYVVCHGSASSDLVGSHCDQTHQYLSNGDDGYCLLSGTEDSYTILDCVGDFNGDPGSGWPVCDDSIGTQNQTLIRNASITTGNPDWTVSSAAATCEWTVESSDYNTDLGSHTCDAPAADPDDLCADVTCPAASGDCYVAGTCDSSTGTCSAETFADSGTSCDDGNDDTFSDSCDGSGVCSGTALTTSSYDWSNNGTVLGTYGNVSLAENINGTLFLTEDPLSGTPYGIIATVTGLSGGEVVTACADFLAAEDSNDSSIYNKGKLGFHYYQPSLGLDDYQGSGAQSAYADTPGTWVNLCHSRTVDGFVDADGDCGGDTDGDGYDDFDCPDGQNDKGGLIIEARLYTYGGSIALGVDNLTVSVTSGTVTFPEAVVDPCADVTCDDANACTTDSCVDGSCVFTNADGLACDDGDGSTVNDVCNAGSCAGIPAVVEGCLDSNATNYDPNATTQSYNEYGTSTCIYTSCSETPYNEVNTCLWADGTSSQWWDGPWNCAGGTACGYSQVDFSVDADWASSGAVNGNFNGWCGSCNALGDADGDGVWTGSVWLLANDDTNPVYEYKFTMDGNNWETLTEGDSCTLTTTDDTGTFTNRTLIVEDTDINTVKSLSTVCFGSCDACPVTDICAGVTCEAGSSCDSSTGTCVADPLSSTVTFDIDGLDDCDQVNIHGSWDQWSGWSAHPDNNWTVDIPAGDHEFVILCVDHTDDTTDDGDAAWYDDVVNNSVTYNAPIDGSCWNGNYDYANYVFNVDGSGNAMTVQYCAGTCDATCPAIAQNLFFSEYAEGSGSNKYLEIYNASSETVDLSSYAYPSSGNGSDGTHEYWNEFDAGATVAAGDVYVICHPSASWATCSNGSSSSEATCLCGSSSNWDSVAEACVDGTATGNTWTVTDAGDECDETHQYLSNGDDGYCLAYGSETDFQVLDCIGDWNADPGSGWTVAGIANATVDNTLMRKADVTTGNADWSATVGTDYASSQWYVLPKDNWDGLGSHPNTVATGCTDENASNYDSTALVNDGSCQYGSSVDVTFSVDMTFEGVADGGSISVKVLGVNDDWVAMDDSDGDNIYTATISLVANATYEYNFYDGWYESGSAFDGDCGSGSYGNNRTVVVGDADLVLDTVCWESCSACPAEVPGCTDSDAVNYNPSANADDGTCLDAWPTPDNLFFSEYAEGSSNNKYLEIYNASSVDVNLSGYSLSSCSNGCNGNETDGWTWSYADNVTFSDTTVVTAGDVYVVCHQSADDYIGAECDQTFTYLSNGDDTFALTQMGSGDILDMIGTIGADPGNGWAVAGVADATKDHTLVRKSTVTTGNAGYWEASAGSEDDDSEWHVLDKNTWTFVGSHPHALVYGCTDVSANNTNDGANVDDGSCTYPLLLTLEACSSATEVRMTGPWWGWDPAGGPFAADNGDGSWTVTFDPAPGDNMEYLWVVDGVQENLLSSDFTCTPITDNWSYANRQWSLGSGNGTDVYGTCANECQYTVSFTADMNCADYTPVSGDVVHVQGMDDTSWSSVFTDLSDDDGDGVWTGSGSVSAGTYEWKLSVGHWNNDTQTWNAWEAQEDLAGLSCATQVPNTNYWNRVTVVTDSDVSETVTYGSCTDCASCSDLTCESWESCADVAYTAPVCECTDNGGNVNGLGDINVTDIVALVGWILGCSGDATCFTAEQICNGDLNDDGAVNVIDVTALVNIILADRISYDDATSANIVLTNNTISVNSDGYVAGVQMTLSHGSNFSLDLEDSYVSEYSTIGNKTTLILVATGNSLEEIATYKGSFEVESIVLCNSNDEIFDVNVINVNSVEVKLTGPNPFNPSTSLNIVVAQDGFVSVNVYNLVGQKVATLLNGYMDANLNGYPVNFNGSNLASGVYLVRAETAGNVSTQKLMLLK
tara:strand:- start:725 stop:6598 length:5874 start_codon:yes stop_codon:yes gene_type:complete